MTLGELIVFGLLGAGMIGIILWLVITTRASYIFYNPKKCRLILKNYSGNRNMQILRALSDGKLKFSDIKHYYNQGTSGTLSYTRQEYILLGNISDEHGECTIITKHSGSNFSTLHEIELTINKGVAVITKHWIAR